MTSRATRTILLAALFALATIVSGFAQVPCGVANQITCLLWDGGSNLYASQNDTVSGFGNFATVYQQFTLPKGPALWDVESFHWVGGYFNPSRPGPDHWVDPDLLQRRCRHTRRRDRGWIVPWDRRRDLRHDGLYR